MTEQIQPKVPNAVATLILGICSIVLDCFFVGLVCGIVGLCISSKGNKLAQTNPDAYSGIGMLKAGRVMSIIGIIFGAIYIILYLVAGSTLAFLFEAVPFLDFLDI